MELYPSVSGLWVGKGEILMIVTEFYYLPIEKV